MNKRILYIALGTIVPLALLGVLEATNVTNLLGDRNAAHTSGPSKEQQQTESKVDSNGKQSFIEDSKGADRSQTDTTSLKEKIDLASRVEGDGTVTVTSKLFSVSDGVCTLSVANGSKSYTAQANVIFQKEFSTCAGFSVPISGLGNGTWTITLTLETGDKKLSNTITQEVRQ